MRWIHITPNCHCLAHRPVYRLTAGSILIEAVDHFSARKKRQMRHGPLVVPAMLSAFQRACNFLSLYLALKKQQTSVKI